MIWVLGLVTPSPSILILLPLPSPPRRLSPDLLSPAYFSPYCLFVFFLPGSSFYSTSFCFIIYDALLFLVVHANINLFPSFTSTLFHLDCIICSDLRYTLPFPFSYYLLQSQLDSMNYVYPQRDQNNVINTLTYQ